MMAMILIKENVFSPKHLTQLKDAKYGIKRKITVFSALIGGSKPTKDATQLMISVVTTILRENVLNAIRGMTCLMASVYGQTTMTSLQQTLDVKHGTGMKKSVWNALTGGS